MLSKLYEEVHGIKNAPISSPAGGELSKEAAASKEVYEEFDKLGRLISREYAAIKLRDYYGV